MSISAGTLDLIYAEQARTLDGLFVQRARRSPDRVAYQRFGAKKQLVSLTWRDMERQVGCWQQALVNEGLRPGDRVAILVRNCPEWVMMDQAALGLGLVTVPLFVDDRAENAAFILEDAAVKLLLIQDLGRWRRLAPALKLPNCPSRVVLLEGGPETGRQWDPDPRLVAAADWLPTQAPPPRQRAGDPHGLASIVYTSGTTGHPKGVMLSHHNMLSVAEGGVRMISVYQEDVFLSFLPLSHTLERSAGYYLPIMAGACVAFSRSVAQLGEDLGLVRPTLMIAVPRVFERIYGRLMEQLVTKSPLERRLFHAAVATGWRRFEYAQGRRGWNPALLAWPLFKRLVADQLGARLGGRLRLAISGGAALAPEVARLFIGLGVTILQGYGLTETSPVVSVNTPEDNDPASVGLVLGGTEIRVGDRDELLVRGPGVMLGYWNNHAATAAMIDADGWLHTGDKVRVERGHIYITGRIKDILVLSNGEKVPPGDMELAISLDPLFEQVLVVGEGRPYLSALLVLNNQLWPSLAQEYGLDPDAPASLADPRLVAEMQTRVRAALQGFPGYAKIRRLALLREPWTVDNDLLTATLKIKRARVLDKHQALVEQLYAEGPA